MGNTAFSELIKYNPTLYPLFKKGKDLSMYFTNKIYSDEQYLKKLFRKYQGYDLDLDNPRTLNEKLQWLKLHDRREIQTVCADKYTARDYIKELFGETHLIPLVYHTTNYRELRPEMLPDFPVVIKTNHGFGNTTIIKDKTQVNWNKLRMDYRRWMDNNYYYFEREWQYKNIKPRIIVEKMLLTRQGKIPNDYKLNFIEGKLEFIYVSVDREGINKRNIYDPEWRSMEFTWARQGKDLSEIRGLDIEKPLTLLKMIEFGSLISREYKYARVDFYDVDGVLYFGEITHCHGGGFDKIVPFEYDLKFGQKINLTPEDKI